MQYKTYPTTLATPHKEVIDRLLKILVINELLDVAQIKLQQKLLILSLTLCGGDHFVHFGHCA